MCLRKKGSAPILNLLGFFLSALQDPDNPAAETVAEAAAAAAAAAASASASVTAALWSLLVMELLLSIFRSAWLLAGSVGAVVVDSGAVKVITGTP